MGGDQDQSTGKGGGSAARSGTQAGGGGNLETCTGSGVLNDPAGAIYSGDPLTEPGAGDPRVEALRDAGLNELWVRGAEIMGFERFVAWWSILDQAEQVLDNRRRLYVPCLEATLLRQQRDEIIASMARDGLSKQEIQSRVDRMGRGLISRSTIGRIHDRARQEAEGAD